MTDVKSAFRIERQALDLRFRSAALAARDWLAPNYVRIRLHGPDLSGFESPGADDHVRLFFPASPPSSAEELRAAPSREYTPLAWEDDWLDIEFAVHGDDGVAAPWAATAPIGSFVGVGGPRGSAVLTGMPDGWLLAGDETAIPAIRRFSELIPAGARARIAIEVISPEHEVAIDAPVHVDWLHRRDARAGSALAAFIQDLGTEDAVGADPFCFLAAEQSIVRPGRALLARWGVDASKAVVKGYWKRGETEYHAPH